MAEPRTQTASFRPRARLVSILGEHMISDHVVGLLELVKNSYDADASRVNVNLEGLAASETTIISVRDDGFGMTASDVVDKFLSPAIDHKSRDKQSKRRSPKGRLPVGEKGVGRFAVQQLGHRLTLITRALNQPEVVVTVDWDAFESSDAYLQDVTFPVVEREPELFTGDASGTQLTMTGARSSWNEASVKKVQRGLRRLQSPHVEDGQSDFTISFSCPEYPTLQSLDPGDILEHAHYRFRAFVDESGTMLYEYKSQHPGVPEREFEAEFDLLPQAATELSGEKPACGPFYLNLYVWDRTTTYMQASGVSRGDLDAMAGVSLFRDHLRVLPYGEPGDDWLRLDRDRINNPSERIGNNQVIGFVEVSQDETPNLRDKTNREGLIDNEAFRDLQTLLRAVVAFYNTLWLKDRPVPKKPAPPNVVPAVTQLQQARHVATAIGGSARPDIMVEMPVVTPVDVPDSQVTPPINLNGHTETTPDPINSNNEGAATTPESPVPPATRLISQQEASRQLVQDIDRAIAAEKQEEAEDTARRDTLLHLAATGMAAERVVHEVGRQVVAALDAINDVREGGTQAKNGLDILEACLGTMRNEFRALAPYEGVTRFQKSSPVDVREAIDIAFMLNRNVLENAGVDVIFSGQTFTVQARSASVIQIFDNLVHNAVSWLSSQENAAEIHVNIDPTARAVVVSDSGPGVPREIAPVVFEPFVSTRPGGRGLGLYISRALALADGGQITLLLTEDERSVTSGANFLVDFAGYRRPTD